MIRAEITRCNYLPEAGSVAPPSSLWPMLTVQWFNIIRGGCHASKKSTRKCST